ncbi:glycosyltransferase family 4 protein [Shewanella alkalitolerans]|uniref:glycosyltransferase family 4 protein n=1 Tax=Shewanella alkalitolerans TaxID=2864209 RepID=UPI001C6602F1|nr:glycosyltransferase family 4 protein [Shewanella alkalitolerans]QYJ98961.1 glycosyltransferase family 4 protein [Shewanella alkalitolerans]
MTFTNKHINILYLHQYFATPESNAGTRSYEMAKFLVAKGHSVTFVTSSAYLSNNYILNAGWNEIVIDGINLHVLHLSYSNKDSFMKRIFKFLKFSWQSTLKSLSIKSDVVFATSTPLTIAIPGLIYSKIKKIPLVFEVRDLWPELPVAVGAIKNPLVIKLAEWLEIYTYKNSTRLIGLSPGMCDGITRHGIGKDKVTLATNSCDTKLFDVDKSIGENYKTTQLSFLNGRKLAVYTGTFGLINNVGYLAELAHWMLEVDDQVCFLAIGDGMEKQMVIDKATELNVLNKNLYILPPVPKTEIVELLSAADISISLFGPVSEMWHNSANKLFDALASSTPIAINYGGWQKDFIEEYQCGLVLDPLDHLKSAKSLSLFLNDKECYQNATMQCHYLAYNKFSRAMMAERIEKTLLEAINDKTLI